MRSKTSQEDLKMRDHDAGVTDILREGRKEGRQQVMEEWSYRNDPASKKRKHQLSEWRRLKK